MRIEETTVVATLQREFKVAVVEAWGCGGPKASADQEAQKAWEGRARERMLKVKRPGRHVISCYGNGEAAKAWQLLRAVVACMWWQLSESGCSTAGQPLFNYREKGMRTSVRVCSQCGCTYHAHRFIIALANTTKRRENWLDNPDRAILEMGGVKVDHSERGDV